VSGVYPLTMKNILKSNKMDGWIKIYRKMADDQLWLSEPFTRAQAWIDLLILANHSPGVFFIRGNRIDVNRGEVAYSARSLALRWRWSRTKVLAFIDYLKNVQQIEPQKNNVTTLISICNYNEYQNNEPQIEPQKCHRNATEMPQKSQNKNEKNNINIYNARAKKKFSEFVELKDDEYTKLVDKYGDLATKRMIEILNNYKGSKGKTYKSDYLAILNWVVDRYNEETQRYGIERKSNDGNGCSQNNQGVPGSTLQANSGTSLGRSTEASKDYSERF
jgi:hypothetical protein